MSVYNRVRAALMKIRLSLIISRMSTLDPLNPLAFSDFSFSEKGRVDTRKRSTQREEISVTNTWRLLLSVKNTMFKVKSILLRL